MATAQSEPQTLRIYTPAYAWQAGYPQSGNTWLCFILAGIVARAPRTWDDGAALIPNWDKVARDKADAPLGWVRYHGVYDNAFQICNDLLYIVRHPFDVMLSSYRYRAQYHGWTASQSAYVDRFIANRGEPKNTDIGTGTWPENVESYLDRPNVTVVRFENLLSNPIAEMRRVLREGVPLEKIQRGVQGADYARMKRLDTQKFVGAGVAGAWRKALTRDQARRAGRAFGDTMEKLGYEGAW